MRAGLDEGEVDGRRGTSRRPRGPQAERRRRRRSSSLSRCRTSSTCCDIRRGTRSSCADGAGASRSLGLIACVEGHGPPGQRLPRRARRRRHLVDRADVPAGPADLARPQEGALAARGSRSARRRCGSCFRAAGASPSSRADDPDALRGVGLDGVVLDEAAFMKRGGVGQRHPTRALRPSGLGAVPDDAVRA